MSTIARAVAVVGSLYGLLRNRLGINVATSLESQELSCTVAPDRRLVVLGHEPIAGFARDHGTVADEAAMLALHTLDSTTLLAEPTFVAPGDSCLRADDPGWRWHCISGHGTALSDWERRPLAGALSAFAVSGHTHAIADVTDLAESLAGKQAQLTNAAALARITATAGGAPKWDGGDWPGGGGKRGLFSGQISSIPTRSGTGFATWINQGEATASDADDGILISCSAQGTDDHRMLVKAAPTAPYEIRALVLVDGGTANANCFLGFYDETRLQTIYVNLDGSISGARWSSVNEYSAGAGFSYAGLSRYSPLWFRLTHDGSNIGMHVSHTGAAWRVIYSHSIEDGYLANYDKIVVGVCPTATAASMLLASYRETAT